MKTKLTLALFIIAILSACQPAPSPTPPAPTRRPQADTLYTMRFPIIRTADDCTYIPGKSLAWSSQNETPHAPKQLCIMAGSLYQNWHSSPFIESNLTHVPSLWGGRTDDFLRDVGPGFAGVALGPNEPDRPDQSGRYWCIELPTGWDCGESVRGAAAVMREVERLRPGIRWVAPSWSNAQTDCRKQAEWWYEYLRQGGAEWRVVGFGFHIYPDWRKLTAGEKVAECYRTLTAAGVPFRPLWVTEVGHMRCDAVGAEEFGRWVVELLEDDRVFVVMAYAPLTGPPFCPFLGSDGGLRPLGVGFREVGDAQAYP